MNKKSTVSVLLLNRILVYLSIMVFVLWILSVIESFMSPDSSWWVIVTLVFYVIKLIFIFGLLEVILRFKKIA